jgi:hypothetical protein
MTRIKTFAANALLVRTKPVKGSRLKLEEPARAEEQGEERTDMEIVLVKDLLLKPRLLTGPVEFRN